MKVFRLGHELNLFNIKKAIAIIIYGYGEYRISIIKNGKIHNENFYAYYIINKGYKSKYYCFNGEWYDKDSKFFSGNWKKKVKQLKREQKLKVFK